jgi:hypothetical protein
MRFLKFKLPLWVAAGLVTTSVVGAEPTVPSRVDTSIYDSFAQAEGEPPVTLMPRAGVPDEDVYQYRAAAPQEAAIEEGATRYLETDFLLNRGIETYGFVDIGIGANAWGADWNGPITFNDRAWQGQMNQLYLINERILKEDQLSWGGRVDLLYGTDFLYTVAGGLDSDWNTGRYYGLAMPQLYGEVGSQELNVKFGHFYTLIGYEVVPAIGNFFYTHAYTMQYGEPFTHTGVLGTWVPNDQLTIIGGVTNGWDNWDNGLPTPANPGPGQTSNAAFLGAITFSSSDGTQALTLANSSGNEANGGQIGGNDLIGNRTVTSIVYTNEFTDKLTYVYQSDFGYAAYANDPAQQNAAGANGYYAPQGNQPGSAYWYGVNQYLFYNFTDYLIGGLRLEWFRDNNGYRVVSGLRDGSPGVGGYTGNLWAMTWGLNYLVGNNLVIRPELRYDWFSADQGWLDRGNGGAGTMPYGRLNDKNAQFYGGCDVIWQF